jgi:hypothetical protein
VGYSPDPAGEFLRSLDVVEGLDARQCLSGHGRTFTDVRGHIEANRTAVLERVERTKIALRDAAEPLTAFDTIPLVYDSPLTPLNANWRLNETLAYLTCLEATGRAERLPGEPEHWRSTIA